MNKKIIGIDLGTTNTVACVWNQFTKTAIPITNSEGEKTTPSVVAYTPEGILIGQNALNVMSKYTDQTAYVFKKLIGKKYADVKDMKVSYKIVEHNNGDAMIQLGDKIVSPIELSSQLLKKIKMDAEKQLGYTIEGAVVTVPAFFNDDQRQATKLAIELAGLEPVRIINEPTAACLYYGLNKKKASTVAVYDFGGGTFDMSILNIEDGLIEVLSTFGDTSLGGSDLDKELFEYIVGEFKSKHGIDLRYDAKDADGQDSTSIVKYRILEAAEKAKKELSAKTSTNVSLPFICVSDNKPLHLDVTVTQSFLISKLEPLVKRTLDCCRKSIELTKSKGDIVIDTVLMVGGSTRIPYVQQEVKKFFGKELTTDVDAMDCVAMGAAVQSGILQGDVEDLILLDVTPFNLGIEVAGGIMHTLIAEQSNIPTVQKQTFSTAQDNQDSVGIRIFEGNRKMANDNKLLGEFMLSGIEKAPRGVPQIEVELSLDRSGILSVKATDLKTKKSMSITVKGQSGLTDEEIKKIKQDAKDQESFDNLRVSIANLRHNLDTALYSCKDEAVCKEITEDEVYKTYFSPSNSQTIAEEDLESAEYKMAEFFKKANEKITTAMSNSGGGDQGTQESDGSADDGDEPINS